MGESFWIGHAGARDGEMEYFLLRLLKSDLGNWCEYYLEGRLTTTKHWMPTDEELDMYSLREVDSSVWDLAVLKGRWDG